jgi:hypothetical protein
MVELGGFFQACINSTGKEPADGQFAIVAVDLRSSRTPGRSRRQGRRVGTSLSDCPPRRKLKRRLIFRRVRCALAYRTGPCLSAISQRLYRGQQTTICRSRFGTLGLECCCGSINAMTHASYRLRSRVTDRQAEQGVSLEAQEAKIRAMATVQSAELLDVIVDGGESRLVKKPKRSAPRVR